MKMEFVRNALMQKIELAKQEGYTRMNLVELHMWLREMDIIYPHTRKELVAWLEAKGKIKLDGANGQVVELL